MLETTLFGSTVKSTLALASALVWRRKYRLVTLIAEYVVRVH